jgi:dihydrofolate reductase
VRELAMSNVVLDVAMSLDGFTAGPNVGQEEPMGEGGERLHEWMWAAGNEADSKVDARFRTPDAIVGAAVVGRRTFDLGVGPCGGTPWPGIPSFVVTHWTREDLRGGNGGTFAFCGLEGRGTAGQGDGMSRGPNVDCGSGSGAPGE